MSGATDPDAAPAHRWWTVAEADAYLPALDRFFDTVEAAVARRRHGGAGGDPRLLLHGLVSLLRDEGIVVRDLGRRLVDFPGRGPDGQLVLWCRVGEEPSIGWWHDPDAGFAGRRNLEHDPPW